MTAVITFVARYGKSAVCTVDDRVELLKDPDIYGHAIRRRLLVKWEITSGKYGELLASGTTLTMGGARWKAVDAAHRPGITREVTR
jgi:hypothetical protein